MVHEQRMSTEEKIKKKKIKVVLVMMMLGAGDRTKAREKRQNLSGNGTLVRARNLSES